MQHRALAYAFSIIFTFLHTQHGKKAEIEHDPYAWVLLKSIYSQTVLELMFKCSWITSPKNTSSLSSVFLQLSELREIMPFYSYCYVVDQVTEEGIIKAH